ncbi:LCP family protein [Lysinibacter cavernae]|uniref:LCP family protein required for cell wall assembly n=1 Tax=Lysinibacter cavernae TaxID=1640652 RepID=A0A7X5TRH1_9MICO|nr:LCP family protein [Lysinibacter cavernae]NIH52146.1 LCP family protein required for cell wall assembly [Lysinibacter cavernae]
MTVPFTPAKPKRGRRWIWISLTLVILLIGGGAAWAYSQTIGSIQNNAVSRPGATDGPEIPTWDGGVNLLVMGSDTRDNQTTGDYGQDETGQRADAMMVLHVSADHTNATVVNIPRDTMVSTPECTTPDGEVIPERDGVQINATLNDGPFCALDTVSQLTGLTLDHFIILDFDGAVAATNAVGGVPVCLTEDIFDPYSGLDLAAGEHVLDGQQALQFVRTRHGFAGESDLSRIKAQQMFLASLMRTVTDSGTLGNPVALYNLASAVAPSITVDDGLSSVDALMGLAGTLKTVDLEKMAFVQLPVEDYYYDSNRVQPIDDQVEALFAALLADEPLVFQSADEADQAAGDVTDDGTVDDGTVDDNTVDDGTGDAVPTPTPTSTSFTVPLDVSGQSASDVTCAG